MMIASRIAYEALIESNLATNRDRAVRDSAPLSVWLEIIADCPQHKSFVAQNKTIPREVLRVLVEDDDRDVRFTLAMRRAVGRDDQIAGVLASDPDPAIRAALARNPQLGLHLLVQLAQDDDDWVRERASETLTSRQTRRRSDPGAVSR
ncbi:HEAT repeat domain-containing protein [Gordonia sp. NPDC058843]|uniref:HEAT repeat domain-containing protein n=1 Tax=Gordonia sp. NPDC058843 TaxID=3346648 RepID=UPI0036AE4E4E